MNVGGCFMISSEGLSGLKDDDEIGTWART